jgi:hypothetical protein
VSRTYGAGSSGDDFVERESIGDAIWAAGCRADRLISPALLGLNRGTRRFDHAGRAAVAEREDHGDGVQPRAKCRSDGSQDVTRDVEIQSEGLTLGHFEVAALLVVASC